jgi:hypothetical protein
MIQRISQSFLKDFVAYKAKEKCGELLRAVWVDDKRIDQPSDAMNLGTYFEYITFGTLPKSGIKPEPVKIKSGEPNADYRRAEVSSAVTKQWFETMGFKVIKTGQHYVKGRHEGVIDVLVECTKKLVFDDMHRLKKGDVIVIDVKYSGLLEDKWSKHGWMWSPIQRQYHGIQAKQYHYITDLPFYFFVKGMANPADCKFFRMEISPQEIEQHLAFANEAYDEVKFMASVDGFENYPSVEKCFDCVLKETCRSRHEYPDAKLVTL